MGISLPASRIEDSHSEAVRSVLDFIKEGYNVVVTSDPCREFFVVSPFEHVSDGTPDPDLPTCAWPGCVHLLGDEPSGRLCSTHMTFAVQELGPLFAAPAPGPGPAPEQPF